MSKTEHDDNYACNLAMPGGLHDHPKYTQKFVRAPKSQYPEKAPSTGKAIPANAHCMRITMGK